MPVLRFTATLPQQEILDYQGKIRVLIAGRRWGKTIGVIANDIPMKCLARPRVEYLMAAPSIPQVKICYDTITSSIPLSRFIKHIELKHYPMIVWHNGSRAHFRTLDQPDLLRGALYDYAWLDEIQNVREWVIDRVVLPTLADRRGRLGISGQGRGEENWIYQRFFYPGQQPENWSWIKSWKFSIRQGVRFQDSSGQAELEQLKAITPPDIWREEYEGEFVSSGRAAFSTPDIQACIRGQVQENPIAGHRYILAVDIGRVADPTAFLLFDSTACAVAQAEVRPLREHATVSAQFAEILRKRFDAVCVVDKTGYGAGSASLVDEYVREYERHVKRLIPFLWSASNKKRVIDRLALGLQKHLLALPAALGEVRRQLGLYEFRKRGDHVICTSPDGDHDDLVAALGMAYNAHELGWEGGPERVAAALQGIL